METLKNLIDYGIEHGWPVGVIVNVAGFIGLSVLTLWVWKYFSRKNAHIIGAMLEISVNLDQQARTLQITTDTMKSLNDNIKMLMAVDERLTESQCVIVYSLMMDSLFGDFKGAYYSVLKWMEDRDINVHNEDHQKVLDDKLDLDFNTAIAELDDQLRNFKYDDKYLHEYINGNFIGEVNHIRVHIYNTIISGTNDVRNYLNRNCDRFKADFNKYLREDQ